VRGSVFCEVETTLFSIIEVKLLLHTVKHIHIQYTTSDRLNTRSLSTATRGNKALAGFLPFSLTFTRQKCHFSSLLGSFSVVTKGGRGTSAQQKRFCVTFVDTAETGVIHPI
jgi:hypothetical protein